jgi:hypothetical protein
VRFDVFVADGEGHEWKEAMEIAALGIDVVPREWNRFVVVGNEGCVDNGSEGGNGFLGGHEFVEAGDDSVDILGSEAHCIQCCTEVRCCGSRDEMADCVRRWRQVLEFAEGVVHLTTLGTHGSGVGSVER